MANTETAPATPAMSIGKAVLFYVGALLTLAALILLAYAAMTRTQHLGSAAFWLMVIGYLVIGFLLNRMVLRGLITWHPSHDTLDRVSHDKLAAFLFWPYKYLDLFFQLLVNKHL